MRSLKGIKNFQAIFFEDKSGLNFSIFLESMQDDIYFVDPKNENGKLRYFFESTGKTNVIKTIEYSPLQAAGNKTIYNLGFGDYNHKDQTVNDTSISNNGDVYKVFNTVLSTIPSFFETIPSGILFVGGSDSSEDYYNQCKPLCRKRCIDSCKNEGRRISLYQRFLNKNYQVLSPDYVFKGGTICHETWRTIIEDYTVGKSYDLILVRKKN